MKNTIDDCLIVFVKNFLFYNKFNHIPYFTLCVIFDQIKRLIYLNLSYILYF